MGGVIGAVSTKFAITAGALLLSARIDMHPAKVVLDPTLQTTRMTLKAAAARGGAADGATIDGEHWIGLGAHMLRIRKVTANASLPADAVLGADVLRSGAFLLDFRSHHVDLLEAGQVRRATSGMKPVPIAASSDGCLAIAGADEGGQPVSAAFITGRQSDEDGAPKALRVGSIRLAVSQPIQPTCPASKLELNWSAFDGRRIVLDLGHDKIWVTPNGKDD